MQACLAAVASPNWKGTGVELSDCVRLLQVNNHDGVSDGQLVVMFTPNNITVMWLRARLFAFSCSFRLKHYMRETT